MKLLKLSIVALSLSVFIGCKKKDDDPKPPTITGLSATTGNVNASITVTGANFSATPASNTVKFGDVQAEVVTATTTSLTVKVPNGSTKGKVSVKVGTFTEAISANEFITTSFIDTRDSQEYGQVYVGTTNAQLWMTRNLNFNTSSGSYCYQDNTTKCTQYGKLYTHDAALNACPEGWRLPTETDFNNLVTTLGGATAAKTALVGTTTTSGMNILYTGQRGISGSYSLEGQVGSLRTSTDVVGDPNSTMLFVVRSSTTNTEIIPNGDKTAGLCVRCIKK